VKEFLLDYTKFLLIIFLMGLASAAQHP